MTRPLIDKQVFAFQLLLHDVLLLQINNNWTSMSRLLDPTRAAWLYPFKVCLVSDLVLAEC